MALFDHVDILDEPKMNASVTISGILDLTNCDAKKTAAHEVVIVNSQSKLIFVADCTYITQLGEWLVYIKNDLIEVAKITQTGQRITISFNRPWYVLDYKYVIELTEKGLEYDKISSGRYFTHSEKSDRHTIFYTILVCLLVLCLTILTS